jgi:aminopeptidase N
MKIIDPHSFTDTDQGRIKHIDFQIKVDFSTRSLQIQAKYHLDQRVTGSFYLDNRGVDIEKVHANGNEIYWEIDHVDPILSERLHLQNLEGCSDFTIELRTRPEASALQWLEPRQTSGGKFPFLYSQCQMINARSIFPCQDTPSIRFTYTARIEVPSPLVAVMAAANLSFKAGDGVGTYHFEMPQPIPSYLFALAVGNITYRSIGSRCGIYSEPELIDAAAWEFAENETKLTEAEKLFGPYVWERYDILVLPPSFPYGGMENPRMTFLSPIFLVGDRSDTVIVTHELAHAWTGNLVTNATWEDFWLNEGWTTYAQTRITEVLEGNEYSQFRTMLSRNTMLEQMERFGMRSPMTCLWFPMRGINPDEVISYIPYHKGNAFLTHLEESVGRETFDKFLKKYITTYRFQSLTTTDFVKFLEKELPEVSQKVDIQEWLYRPGFPDTAPKLKSHYFDDVAAKADAFGNGQSLKAEDILDWKPAQVQLFLRLLPERIAPERCRELENLFGFKESSAAAPLSDFYILAIRSGYQSVLPGIEHFVATIGRHFLLSRLFHAMAQNEWIRGKTRSIFERYKHRHHPITAANLEKQLLEARL